jgi:hypothetical protein
MTTRGDMAQRLSLSAGSPTKTFVLEVHTDEPIAYLADLVGSHNVEPTDDAFLFQVHLAEDVIWVDQLDGRFWSFHTDMPAAKAGVFLSRRVSSRRDLDWMWLPSDHLRHVWPGAASRRVRTNFQGSRLLGGSVPVYDVRVQLSGENAEELLDYISDDVRYRSAVSFDGVQVALDEPDLGYIQEAVNRMGRFAVSGDSLEFHFQFVRTVVQRYRRLVMLCEERAMDWTAFDRDTFETGASFKGYPIHIKFSRPIPDLEIFLDELFSSREPFRLWGIPRIDGDGAEVEAVDLHVGDLLRLDFGTDWMRIYLAKGACGNTVARLVSNLQHRFDGALSFLDPELQTALKAYAGTYPKAQEN